MRALVSFLLLWFAADSALASDPRGADPILQRIDELIADDAHAWSQEVGIDYPPELVVFRAFKRELEFEIWAGNDPKAPLRLVRTLEICAVIEERGPKLKGYDKRTPEGFYHLAFRFKSKLPWMWIKLEPGEVDDFGEVGDGSPFYMHLDYPNEVDAAHSGAAGYRVPRGQICLHGNCGTEGCVSLDNQDFLSVFAFAGHHDSERFGKPQLHLLPFRFDRAWDFATESAEYVHLPKLGKQRLRRFWHNLREGHDTFDEYPRPLRFRFGQAKAGDGGTTRYLFEAPPPRYESVLIEDVPHVRQLPDYCGEACVEMMARKLGLDIDQRDVFAAAGQPELDRGLYTRELKRALENLGFSPGRSWYHVSAKRARAGLERQWRQLHRDLLAGVPSIICMHYDETPDTTEHFRLILGYDAASDEVIFHEPAVDGGAYRRMKRDALYRLWPLKYAAERWTVIRLRLAGPTAARPDGRAHVQPGTR